MKETNIDHRLSHGFADAAQRSPVGRKLADIAAGHLLWFVGGAYAFALLFIWEALGRAWAMPFVAAVLASWGVTMALEYLIGRKRPFQELDKPLGVRMLWVPPSFPSGHATIAFSVATAMSFVPVYGSLLAQAAFVIAIVISVGRVAVRAHFVTDVLAGAVVGTVITSLILTYWPL